MAACGGPRHEGCLLTPRGRDFRRVGLAGQSKFSPKKADKCAMVWRVWRFVSA